MLAAIIVLKHLFRIEYKQAFVHETLFTGMGMKTANRSRFLAYSAVSISTCLAL
jgi:hypothetical protein